MKIPFKNLSFIFSISLIVLALPLYSYAKDEVIEREKNILIIKDPYKDFGSEDYGGDNEHEVVGVSLQTIRDLIKKGKPIHFAKGQYGEIRTIKSEWILGVLDNETDIKAIDIDNAIITGNLDFCIASKLVDIEECDIREDAKKHLRLYEVEKTYLISPSIKLSNCRIEGNILAGYNEDILSNVMLNCKFDNSIVLGTVNLSRSYIRGYSSFDSAAFKNDVDFSYAYFDKWAIFRNANFYGKTDFGVVQFSSGTNFINSKFNNSVSFFGSNFIDDVYFDRANFGKTANFYLAKFHSENVDLLPKN